MSNKWFKSYNRPLTLNQAQIYSMSCANPLKKLVGKGIYKQKYVIKKNNADGYFDKQEWNIFQSYVFDNLLNNTNFLKTSNEKTLKQAKELESYFITFQKIDFTSLNNAELLKIYKKARNVLFTRITPLWLGFIFEETIEKKLLKVLTKYNLNTSKNINLIQSPSQLNHILSEKIDLLKIKLQPKDKQEKLLLKHYNKYKYIPCYGPDIKPYSLSFFQNRLKNASLKKANKNIKEIKNNLKNNKKQYNSFINKHNFSKKDLLFINYVHEFSFLKDYRSHFRSIAMYHYSLLLSEIAHRNNLNIKEISFLIDKEVISLLSSTTKTIKKKIQKRSATCSYIFNNYKETIRTQIKTKKEIDKKILTGQIANKGIARGKVKIILNPEEINKVDKGDILVSTMTRPDYIIAMQKSAAIITDEGGLTCHAAIVSREMNKPCIVGTKTATETLKDGDTIEVNANTGIITIIK